MYTGVDYLASEEKENFDRQIARLLTPTAAIAKLGARATFGFEPYADVRVGQHGDKFDVNKIKTLDDDGNPINRFAELFRKLGLDETPQVASVRAGNLSIVGRRQLVPEEHELMRIVASRTNASRSLLAEWDEVVLPYKCGLLSSFALECHQVGAESVERRLELDIQDSLCASKHRDWVLIRSALTAVVSNRLRYGTLPLKG